ncbi:hypothetical protein QJS10_CPB17g00700 [Acorus calamus]|uniref:Uncharacterized protein n=1 Tax=Acorus calamus TaxID=4465 RepID=A0AAV9CV09_ACOCL|nr:hypothetical protein QJS10_CPB17g00700 [Acorus calamus]
MEKPSNTKPSSHHTKPPPSKAELLSSAKVVAGPAKATLSHDSQKVDMARVAGATADIEELRKAEAYLHQYHSSQSSHQPPPLPAVEVFTRPTRAAVAVTRGWQKSLCGD